MSTGKDSTKQQDVALRSPRFDVFPLSDARTFAFYDMRSRENPFSWHYHRELELILWPKARGVRFVGDSIEEFHGGDFCLIGSNLPHSWSVEAASSHTTHNFQVLFLPDCLGASFMNLAEMSPMKELLERARRGLMFEGRARERAAEVLEELAAGRLSSSARFGRILQLLLELADSKEGRFLASIPTAAAGSPRANTLLSKVMDFVQGHLAEDPRQARAAALLGLSPAAFSRFFRRHVGKTYVGFINEMRIGKACMALLQTDQTVSEIAYAVGYQNLSHFNEQFRAYKKMPPREYRRRAQERGLRSTS